jgi:microcystin-dependent protein
MASDAIIQFTFAGLLEPYCFTTPGTFALDIVNGLSGFVPGEYSVIIDSDATPALVDQDKLWHHRPGGAPSGKIYAFYLGQWVTPNREAPSSDVRKWWVGTEANVWWHDGGDGNDPATFAPTPITGAMWEVDHDYDFRFPLGAGTSSAPQSTVVASGATGGEEDHTLLADEVPLHGHAAIYNTGAEDLSDASGGIMVGPGSTVQAAFTGTPTETRGQEIGGSGGDPVGATTPHNTMPPYRVGFWIKRTARIYEIA